MKQHTDTYVLVLVTFLRVSARQYCSNNEQHVLCLPCHNDGIEQYICPRQCSNSTDTKLCDRVCSGNCINSECEFDDKQELICQHGCNGYYTGPYCQEYCMDDCVKCTQDNIRCFQCQHGRYGARCLQTCNNCIDNTCDINGTCSEGCTPGFYGGKCDELCANCGKKNDDSNCDRINGRCLLGCTAGYYGAKCDRKCHSRCTQCEVQTGECRKSEDGFDLKDSNSQKLVPEIKETDNQEEIKSDKIFPMDKAKTGSNTFKTNDYLWTVIVCLAVLWVTTAAACMFIIWRCKRKLQRFKTTQQQQPSNTLEGNGGYAEIIDNVLDLDPRSIHGLSGESVEGGYCEINEQRCSPGPCLNHELPSDGRDHISSRNRINQNLDLPPPCSPAQSDRRRTATSFQPETEHAHVEIVLENHRYASADPGDDGIGRLSTSSLVSDEHFIRKRENMRPLQEDNSYETRSLCSVTSEDLRLTRKTESMLLWEQNTDFSKVYVKYITPKLQNNYQENEVTMIVTSRNMYNISVNDHNIPSDSQCIFC